MFSNFEKELRLLHANTHGSHRQVARARFDFNRFGNLWIVSGQHLDRADRAVSGLGKLVSDLRLDEVLVPINLWKENLPVCIFGHVSSERLEDRRGHGKVGWLDIMSKLNGRIRFIFL